VLFSRVGLDSGLDVGLEIVLDVGLEIGLGVGLDIALSFDLDPGQLFRKQYRNPWNAGMPNV
jgi:hypothetical protein